jgi:hypothetical protein
MVSAVCNVVYLLLRHKNKQTQGEEHMNERIDTLKEMVEKTNKPVGWIGYYEGLLVSFLQIQEQVNSFLTATDPAGRVEPVYTHPAKEQLTDEEIVNLYKETEADNGSIIEFARSILRKESEK